jgi:hypothetical protein
MDMCHFNAFGHRLIGERLADYLLDNDLLLERTIRIQ